MLDMDLVCFFGCENLGCTMFIPYEVGLFMVVFQMFSGWNIGKTQSWVNLFNLIKGQDGDEISFLIPGFQQLYRFFHLCEQHS